MRKVLPARLLSCAPVICVLVALLPAPPPAFAAPTTTVISDVIYRGDGRPAAGTLLISWPAFTSADHQSVAAGTMSVTLSAGGVLDLALVPNEGGTPAGTYYKVVLKLEDGTTTTEYWTVPLASPAKIASIRAVVVPAGVAVQTASRQYVDSVLAAKANDAEVMHKAGDETVQGAKLFAVSPTVPTPASADAAANRAYVDSAVTSANSDFIHKSGDSMSGPLTLSGDPVSSQQASNRHYVDTQVAGLTGGLAQKLSRFGDTPTTLAAIRFADQFGSGSVHNQIDAAISDCGGARCVIVIPSSMAPGEATAVPDNVRILDLRGSAGPNAYGDEGMNFYNNVLLRGRTTAAAWGIYSPLHLHHEAFSGGQNLGWPSQSKTQYEGLTVTLTGRTVGERKSMVTTTNCFGKGDCTGPMATVYDWGGYHFSGDEQSEGGRFHVEQGAEIFTATVAGVASNSVTYSGATNANTVGEERPLIITTPAKVYSTGQLSASPYTAPCLVTGTGTAWADTFGAGAKTNLFLELKQWSTGIYRYVVPIKAINSNTEMLIDYKLAEVADTCIDAERVYPMDYAIYKGGLVKQVGTASDLTLETAADFQAGDSIELPLGYNHHGLGLQVLVGRKMGPAGRQGGGIHIGNLSPLDYRSGIDISGSSGGFQMGLLFRTPITNAVVQTTSQVARATPILDLQSTAAGVQNLWRVRDTLNNLYYQQWDATNKFWSLPPFTFAPAGNFGLNANPQAGHLGYLRFNDATSRGLTLVNDQTSEADKHLLGVYSGAYGASGARFHVYDGYAQLSNVGLRFAGPIGAGNLGPLISQLDYTTDSNTTVVSVLNNSGAQRALRFDRNVTNGQYSFYGLHYFGSDGIGVNAVAQAATSAYIRANDAAFDVLKLVNDQTPAAGKALIAAAAGGSTVFRVDRNAGGTGYQTTFNQGMLLRGFSGDYSGQTWSIDGATGNASFANIPVKPAGACNNGTTDKLLIDANGQLSCGADQTSAGGSGITALGGLTATTQLLSTGNSGTAPNWGTSGADTHVLNIPLANTAGVTAGLISKAQYDTFAAKQDALGFTPENPASKGVAGGYASLDASSRIPVVQLPVMGASGASHAAGAVPDPGAEAGTTKFLREDGAWAAPPASSESHTYTIVSQNPLSPADATTYCAGIGSMTASGNCSASNNVPIAFNGNITKVCVAVWCSGTAPSTEAGNSFVLRLNTSTDTTIASGLAFSSARISACADVNVSATSSDSMQMRWTTASFAANPTSCMAHFSVFQQ